MAQALPPTRQLVSTHPMPSAAKPAALPRPMPKRDAAEVFRRLAEALPEPKTELAFSDPYTLLVAVALSAQATDVSVNKATAGLFKEASTPAQMVALGEAGVAAHIRTIGLWRNKARNVIALSHDIIVRFDGEVPQTREELMTLAGVGRKTANVVLNEAFGQPTMAVDTHIFRVSNRTRLAPGKTPDAVEQGLLRCVPEPYAKGAHHWLILHGRYTCVARTPKCGDCIIRDLCRYRAKTG